MADAPKGGLIGIAAARGIEPDPRAWRQAVEALMADQEARLQAIEATLEEVCKSLAIRRRT